MADVNVLEKGTYPAEPIINSLFSKLPSDLRFINTEYRQFSTHTSVSKNSSSFSFVLERLDAPYCYLLEDALIKVNLIITKKDGVTLPDTNKIVAPVNNVLGSLFEDMRMKINDDELTQNGQFYPYKCYLKKLLTFSEAVKSTQLNGQGYYDDVVTDNEDIEPHSSNHGWTERNAWFREGVNKMDTPYRVGGATFIGSFDHDLQYVGKPLPPGTKVSFTLTRSSDDFFLMKDPSDTESYRAIVLNCFLYVKIAKMSDHIYRELETKFTKEPICYQFRKFVVKEISVPVLSRNFVTGNLFPDSEIPCKLHFVLVDTNARHGNQSKNPFQFPRKFTIKKEETDMSSNLAVEINQTCMYEKLKDMHKENRNLQQQLANAVMQMQQTVQKLTQPGLVLTPPVLGEPLQSTSSGNNISAGITTRSGTNTTENFQSVSSPVSGTVSGPSSSFSTSRVIAQHRAKGTKKVRPVDEGHSAQSSQTFHTSQEANFAAQDDLDEEELENAPAQIRHQRRQEILNATEFPVYIESFEVDINSAPINQFKSENTEDECIADFVRLLKTDAFMGSLQSNSITYLNYRCGFYIAGFDLTTAQDGGLDLYSVPATMKGYFL